MIHVHLLTCRCGKCRWMLTGKHKFRGFRMSPPELERWKKAIKERLEASGISLQKEYRRRRKVKKPCES